MKNIKATHVGSRGNLRISSRPNFNKCQLFLKGHLGRSRHILSGHCLFIFFQPRRRQLGAKKKTRLEPALNRVKEKKLHSNTIQI